MLVSASRRNMLCPQSDSEGLCGRRKVRDRGTRSPAREMSTLPRRSSCIVSSTSHIAARRCGAKQFNAPNSANVRNSSFASGTRRLKSSNDSNCRSSRCLTSSSACSCRNPFTTQSPSRTVLSSTTVQRQPECATQTGLIFSPCRCASFTIVAGV